MKEIKIIATIIATISIETIVNAVNTVGPIESTVLMIAATAFNLYEVILQKQQGRIAEVVVSIVCEKKGRQVK